MNLEELLKVLLESPVVEAERYLSRFNITIMNEKGGIKTLYELVSEIIAYIDAHGCKICNDTSNYRHYRNLSYKYCPYCGNVLP